MSHRGVGRPVKPVVLNDSERSFLQGVVSSGHVGKQAQMRCRAILLCAEGLSNGQVGEKLGISDNRVSILRGRFLKSCAQEQSNTVVKRPRNVRNGGISATTRRWAYGSRGKSANPVQLTREERFALENCLRDLDTTSAIAARCRIILLCADGLSNRAIAKELGLSSNTAREWRARFLKDRIDGLLDKRKANRGYRLARGLGGPAIDLVRDGQVRTPPAVVLDEDERLSLKSLTRGLRGTGARSDRCRMILRCADGLTDEEVAADLGVGRKTVDRWQQCFLEDGIWGLLSRPWLGLGSPLTSEQAAEVIDRSLNATPVDAPRWTAQGMAAATGLSTTTVQRIWSALGVYPRPWKMLELSQNPLFVERVSGIAGLYLQPPVRAMVLCVEDRAHARADDARDEADQTQDLDRTQPAPPPPQAEAPPRDRRVLGTNPLLVALDAAAGFDPSTELARFQAEEVHEFLQEIDRRASSDQSLHLVMDHSIKFESAKIRKWLSKRPRWQIHVAPTCAAWVYQAEHWFAELTHKQSELDETDPIQRLTGDIRAFVGRHFYLPEPFIWPGSTHDSPAAVEHSGPVIERTRAANARSPSKCNHSRLSRASEPVYPAGMSNLGSLFTYNCYAVFDRAVQLLLDARRVLIIGMALDHACAIHMHQIATMRFRDWHLVESIDPVSDPNLADLGPADVVVAIGTDPCCDGALKVADYARSRFAKVIGLTDWSNSSLVTHAHEALFASIRSPGPFPSQVDTVILAEALVGTVMARHADRHVPRHFDE